MDATIRDAITSAVLYLAGVCDYARSFDGQGFNKPDSHLGHDLARRAQHRDLEGDELHAAWALCRKYADTQLAGAGIALPTEDAVRERFGTIEPPEIPRTAGVISLADGELDVTFPYDPARVEVIRALRRRHGGSGFAERDGVKSWRLSLASLDDLLRACPHFERWLEIVEARWQAAEAVGRREQSVASPERTAEHGVQRYGQISLHGLHLRIEFPYDPDLVQRIKMLRQTYGGPGFQNDASGKYWLLALAATEALTEAFPQLTWTADAEAVRTRRAQQRSAYEQLPPLFR
ncbi:MAG: hypothetical protein RLZZ387_2301 [Chloroflexota bacterium]|jgi:hypothetical protein